MGSLAYILGVITRHIEKNAAGLDSPINFASPISSKGDVIDALNRLNQRGLNFEEIQNKLTNRSSDMNMMPFTPSQANIPPVTMPITPAQANRPVVTLPYKPDTKSRKSVTVSLGAGLPSNFLNSGQ